MPCCRNRISLIRFSMGFQMGSLRTRGRTAKGRRIYLLVAAVICLMSILLLVIRSWSERLPFRTIKWKGNMDPSGRNKASNHGQYSDSDRENTMGKGSQKGLTWFVQVSDNRSVNLCTIYSLRNCKNSHTPFLADDTDWLTHTACTKTNWYFVSHFFSLYYGLISSFNYSIGKQFLLYCAFHK